MEVKNAKHGKRASMASVAPKSANVVPSAAQALNGGAKTRVWDCAANRMLINAVISVVHQERAALEDSASNTSLHLCYSSHIRCVRAFWSSWSTSCSFCICVLVCLRVLYDKPYMV